MSALFASNELFEISISYMEVKTKSGVSIAKILDEKIPKDKEFMTKSPDRVKKLTTFWHMANWKSSNELYKKYYKYDEGLGRKDLDWAAYRASVLEIYMKKWDITKDSGEPIPCAKENIDNLEPSIAVALVDKWLSYSSISEEELGN